MNGNSFDSNIVRRAGLPVHAGLIKAAQEYFNSFARQCAQSGVLGTFCIHRCLLIGIFGHKNTKNIAFGAKGLRKLDKKHIETETLNIVGFNGRSYVITVHDDHSLVAGVVAENIVYSIGDEIFQEDGIRLVEEIRRIGFLTLLASHQTHDKLISILHTLNSQEKTDVYDEIKRIKSK